LAKAIDARPSTSDSRDQLARQAHDKENHMKPNMAKRTKPKKTLTIDKIIGARNQERSEATKKFVYVHGAICHLCRSKETS
jgi:hypothetical protein